jgi:hypothetical protein
MKRAVPRFGFESAAANLGLVAAPVAAFRYLG